MDTVNVARFNGTSNDDFHLYYLRLTAALRRERKVAALTNENVSMEITDDAMFSLLSFLGDNPLQAI